ncbi:MAG TPA: hypothetical protein VIV12_16360, partial [Streptosporangiaceae bacterium]
MAVRRQAITIDAGPRTPAQRTAIRLIHAHQHFCDPDQHASKACLSRLAGKRARPVLTGRRSNAPPLPGWRIWFLFVEWAGLDVQLVRA